MTELTSDGERSLRDRLTQQVFLDLHRETLAAALLVGVVLLTRGLIWIDLLTVDPKSLAGTAFGSGAVAGLFTLITVVLSINQLILSRVFGSPKGLRDEFQGTREVRGTVADITSEAAIPTDPGQFLARIGEGLMAHADRLGGDYAPDLQSEVDEYGLAVAEYGERIAAVTENDRATNVLTSMLGARYADLVAETERLQRARGDDLDDADRETLDEALQLLEATSIVRQYFKTLTIQQNLAKVSRQVAITGFVALLAAFYVGFVYRTGADTSVNPTALPWVVSIALGVVLSPLIVLLVHIFRISTIMWYTVSVGPFVRPER
ncbi:hypothetical protein G9464_12620 [Halostella sp. JP-L12]|uniref:hypothetical protein n=1 Tax=Halostella TaxID=1843185 RepID=UPI000EF77F23|nr:MULTISPECIES: hypothetical protein [Halostella]NHN48431.1 hypothetical protein [Halostella sp. JP-L12]